jgi:hypothetical protein
MLEEVKAIAGIHGRASSRDAARRARQDLLPAQDWPAAQHQDRQAARFPPAMVPRTEEGSGDRPAAQATWPSWPTPRGCGLGEPGVSIYGIDALASAVLRRTGTDIAVDAKAVLGVGTQQVSGRTPNVAWQDALDAAGSMVPSSLRSAAFLAAEYAQVVLPNGTRPGGVLQGAPTRARRGTGPGQTGRCLGRHPGISGAGAGCWDRRLSRGGDHRRGPSTAGGRHARGVRSRPRPRG